MTEHDLFAVDRDDRPILFIDVFPFPDEVPTAEEQERAAAHALAEAPFYMIQRPDDATLYARPEGTDGEFPRSVHIEDFHKILARYDEHYRTRFDRHRDGGIRRDYVETLTWAWLNDLVDPWKPGVVPYRETLASIGLLERLKGGGVFHEVSIADALS